MYSPGRSTGNRFAFSLALALTKLPLEKCSKGLRSLAGASIQFSYFCLSYGGGGGDADPPTLPPEVRSALVSDVK